MRAKRCVENDLTVLLADIPALKKLVVIDTCHSQPLGDALHAALLSRGKDAKTALTIMGRDIGVTVLGAAATDEEALEGYKEHGLFTYIVSDGLAGSADLAKHGVVTNDALTFYVRDTLPSLAENLFNHTQHPTADANGLPFTLTKVK